MKKKTNGNVSKHESELCDCGKPGCWGGLNQEDFNTRVKEEALKLATYLVIDRDMSLSGILCVIAMMFVELKKQMFFSDKQCTEASEVFSKISKLMGR